MSKRLIILIYVVAVLLFSGYLAQAKTPQDSVNVTQAKLDQSSGILLLGGQLSNTCLSRPSASLEKVDQHTSAIVLSVVASNRGQRCNDQLGPQYEVSIDLKELPLTQGHEYTVIINNYSGPRVHLGFIAPANAGFMQINGYEARTFSGIINEGKQRDQIMISKNDKTLPVETTSMDLGVYANQNVQIKGYAVQDENAETVIIPVSVSVLK